MPCTIVHTKYRRRNIVGQDIAGQGIARTLYCEDKVSYRRDKESRSPLFSLFNPDCIQILNHCKLSFYKRMC